MHIPDKNTREAPAKSMGPAGPSEAQLDAKEGRAAVRNFALPLPQGLLPDPPARTHTHVGARLDPGDMRNTRRRAARERHAGTSKAMACMLVKRG